MSHPESEPVTLPEIVPVFPLPNVVLFPMTVLPLHIFEPRYRRMTARALQAEKIIVMALLDPSSGSAAGYVPGSGITPGSAATPVSISGSFAGGPAGASLESETPSIYRIACAGRIVDSALHPDGRYDIILTGVVRVEIEEELPGGEFRRARVRPRPEKREWLYSNDAGGEIIRLLSLFKRLRADVEIITKGVDLIAEPAAREITLNTIAMHLNVPPVALQKLLEQDDIGERARLVGEILSRSQDEVEVLDRFRDQAPDDPQVN